MDSSTTSSETQLISSAVLRAREASEASVRTPRQFCESCIFSETCETCDTCNTDQTVVSDQFPTASEFNEVDLAVVFEENRSQLRRLVSLRLNRRLATRIDASDVLQDAYIRASSNLEQCRTSENMSLSNWLRIQTRYAVGDCHRRHLHAQKRDARLEERAIGDTDLPAVNLLAESIVSASSVVAQEEIQQQVLAAISKMSDLDREILILRHLEGLTIADAAVELEINTEAAKKRHFRALKKLQQICKGMGKENESR